MAFHGNKGWLGLELGARTITLAQAERGPSGVRIAASAVVKLDGETRDSTDAPPPPDFLAESRDLSDALKLDPAFSGRKVACILPMHLTEMNVVTMPPAPEAERRAMIAHELSSFFPHDWDQREFDFWVADAAAVQGKPGNSPDVPQGESINVLSVRRSLVSDVVRNLARAGMRCQAVDGLPFALSRAVHLACDLGENVSIGAVHWGDASGTLCIVSGRGPQFTRHLRNCGVGSLVQKVARALGLSHDEATRVLADHGLPHPECREPARREIQEAVAEVTSQELGELVAELNKTLAFVRLKYPDLAPDRLCLFGEGARVRNAALHVGGKVGLPTDVWRLPHAEQQDGGQGALGTAVALSTLAWTR